MLNNTVISFIRTYVPVWIGALLAALTAYLNSHHILWIHVDNAEAASYATALVISIYYGVVRILEKKFPKMGILLGHIAKPLYSKPGE